ncbi:MAG TPA: 50S ribosomal protein L11 methyltransferase [Gaiella sp.]
MPVWRVSVRVPTDEAEEARARVLELAPQGFEERDVESGVELALYAETDELERLRPQLPAAAVEPVDDGWDVAWRAFHRPVHVAGLWVGAPWEPPPDPTTAVVIDPGRAFGTGAHPTTRLCLELLAASERRGSLLDVGCGSGVLAIAAVRLGFGPVVAVDADPVAVETTLANAEANGVSLDARILDATHDALPRVDVAVANVLLEPVEAILARLAAAEAIASGYLAGERPVHVGWTHVETLELDGWAADRFLGRR